MRAAALVVLSLGCADLNTHDPLEGIGTVVRPEDLAPVVVALATPGPAATLTPPGEVDGQLFISGEEAWSLLAVDVQHRPAAPPVPPVLRRRGVYLWAVFRVCANERGAISAVTQLKSAAKLVDEDWRRAVRSWRFHPLVRDGAAKSFCSDVPVGAKVM
jgi:hypothetical protein